MGEQITPSSKFVIRSALPRDVAKFAPHFPLAFQYPTETRLFVIEYFTGEMLGGGYVLRVPGGSDAVFDFHIVDPKNRAASDALLIFLQDFCRLKNYPGLAPAKSISENSALDHLLKAHNFECARVLTKYEVEVETLLARIEPTFQQIQKRGKIPADTKIISLRDAPFFAIGELILRTIGSNSLGLERQLSNHFFCENTSKIVQVGPEIVGAILIRMTGEIPEVAYLAVDPNRRNSWVYAMLSREFLTDAKRKNCRTILLKTFHPAIVNHARRAGGKVTGREFIYRRDFRSKSISQREPNHPQQSLD
jgi:hypothetical protein